MAFWACAQLQPQRTALALHFLGLEGFRVYHPLMRFYRQRFGRKVETTSALFPGYCFIEVMLQWHRARRTPGVVRLIMDGEGPAHVPDRIITELRANEVEGYTILPKAARFRQGEEVRVTSGPFCNHLAIFDHMTAHERVAVLLDLLGSRVRTELPAAAIEPARRL